MALLLVWDLPANAVVVSKTARLSRVWSFFDGWFQQCGRDCSVTAAGIAKTFGIRVYTIGVGTRGTAPYPFQTAFGVQYQNIPVDIDEPTLRQIASTTGGEYFRATDNSSLKRIYSEIDKMEKSKISVQQF